MATFPTALDSFTFPGAGDSLSTTNVLHHLQHDSANSAISALEYVVGINGSTTATTLQYKVSALAPFTATSVYDAGHHHTNTSLDSLAMSKLVTGGFKLGVTAATAAFTANSSNDIIRLSGTFTASLPAAIGQGKVFYFKNYGVGTASISASGADRIDGAITSQLTAQYQRLVIADVSGGTGTTGGFWDILGA
jgi:hypothetical protein